jgi:hypothetical protein
VSGRISPAFILFVAGDLAAYGFTCEALNKTQTMEQVLSCLNIPLGQPHEGRIVAAAQITDDSAKFRGNELLLAGWRQADTASLLVLLERYSSAKKATDDGFPAAVVRAQVDFMGCVVPSGDHTVRFSFEPGSLRIGRLVSLVAAMLLLIYIAARNIVG